jgi:hypothetical protein
MHAAMLGISGRGAQGRAVIEGTQDGLRRHVRQPRIERYLDPTAATTS